MQYYAHSLPDTPPSEWQPLEDHLYAVADKAREFAEGFGFGDWAYLAGLWHDLGKYSLDFQQKVLGSNSEGYRDGHVAEKRGRVDHSSAGAQWADAQETWHVASRFISYAIAGHHAGLPDYESDNNACLIERLKKRIPATAPPIEIASPPYAASPSLPAWNETGKEGYFSFSFAIRMIFSCLVDADCLDTESFCDREKHSIRNGFPSAVELKDALERRLAKFDTAEKTTVNKVRQAVSSACRLGAKMEPGFFSLTVPTGGGKTLASMRFALHHALKYEKRRVIYAIPYTSIIEQTVGVFRDVFGEEVVVEHHSRVEANDAHETTRTRLAVENWEAPVVVTTNVQFFESLFADRTSRCRKLHNIAGSVIILDEAQMLPISLLIPTLAALKELVAHYGCSVVLCTATQPALVAGDHLPRGLQNVREIIPEPRVHFNALKRVRIHAIGRIDWVELTDRLAGHDHVLCIVNSRRDAQEIYAALLHKTERRACFYLTTYLCPKHRDAVFEEIKRRLRDGEPCRIVSTQLIEAGVDIDLPVVFRAVAGIDSILQAAGRCNRHGTPGRLGEVFVFEGERPAPQGLLRQTARIGAEFLGEENDITEFDAITRYFARLYQYQDANLDARDLMKLLEHDGAQSLRFQFREIAERYKLITSEDVPIVIRYDKKAEELIQTLRYAPSPRAIVRLLQPYIVTVPQNVARTLAQRGDVYLVADLIYVLERKDLYEKDGAGFVMREFADMEPAGLTW